VAKVHFNHLKLRNDLFSSKNLIGKCQISKYRGAKGPLPTPVNITIIIIRRMPMGLKIIPSNKDFAY